MPIFQYDTYRNAFGPSIAEALAHQADPQADAARRTADLQAAAAERAAAIQGQLWTTLGAIPQQIQASQDAAQQRAARQQQQQLVGQQIQEGALTLQDKQRQRDAETAVAHAVAQVPLLADGTYDIPGISKAVDPRHGPALIPVLQRLDTVNTAITAHAQQQQAQQEGGAQRVIAAGSSPLAADNFLVAMAKAGRIPPEVLAQLRQALQDDPSQAESILRQYAGLPKGENVPKDTVRIDPLTNKPIFSNVSPDKPTEASLAVDAAKGDPTAIAALARLKPPPDDQVIAGLFGKQATGQTLTASETALLEGWKAKEGTKPTTVRMMLNGRPVEQTMTTTEAMKLGAVAPIPPASVQVLNQTLAGGQHVSDTAQMIADYKIGPPSSRSLATPAGELLMAQVKAANPAYDATQFPTRQKMRVAFSSGPQSQTINSLNTAIGHLDQFTEVVKALDNGNFQPGNAAYNWLRTTFGQSAPTNFAGIRSIMSGELAAAFKKSGATDQEIASVEQAIASKNSTGQLLDYVQTIALPALGSKVVSFDQQYRQVMGAADPFQILLPESAQILQKYGIDPAHPTMGARAPTGTGFSVTTPDGVRHTFPSAAALDGFKRAAGLP